MRCKICSESAVYDTPNYCAKHFAGYFEGKVLKTIKDHRMIAKKDKVAVAVSGGKDSLVLLSILSKRYDVEAICIDEGIAGYRERTIKSLKDFAGDRIRYRIFTFKEEVGKTLDGILAEQDIRPCTVCGIFRRKLLNRHSKGFDVIATGHNMDDVCQAIIMNLFKNNFSLMSRQGPVSGNSSVSGLTKRVKPLYFCTEREVMAYSILKGITTDFVECPNVHLSFRHKIRDWLNQYEGAHPGAKINIIRWYLKNYRRMVQKKESTYCQDCGEPSCEKICSSCRMLAICS
jgi:uncharacterized protein (TIGR00269 family)